MSQLVGNVIVFLFTGFIVIPPVSSTADDAAASAPALALPVRNDRSGVVLLRFGDHDLRGDSGEDGLKRLRFRVHFVQIPSGGTQVAEWPHHAAVVPAAAHGYFSEGIALPAAAAGAGAGLPVLVVSRRAGMTGGGRRKLADVQLTTVPGGGGGGVWRIGPESEWRGITQQPAVANGGDTRAVASDPLVRLLVSLLLLVRLLDKLVELPCTLR